jgi:hypothetical protein
MSSFIKKLVIILSVVILILFISLLIAAWSLGMFSAVAVNQEKRGPYFVVVQAHIGSYQGISNKIDEVSLMLASKQIIHSTACGLFYDDPSKTPIEELYSEGGFIVSDSLEVIPPFKCIKIPARTLCIASIDANPAIAGFKTYPALADWIEKYNFVHDTLHPTLELYHTNGLVEVELPIRKM